MSAVFGIRQELRAIASIGLRSRQWGLHSGRGAHFGYSLVHHWLAPLPFFPSFKVETQFDQALTHRREPPPPTVTLH
jgi:hypothetical protein